MWPFQPILRNDAVVPRRSRAAAAGWHVARLVACMRRAPRADIYYIDAFTIRASDVRDNVSSRTKLHAFRIASSLALISLEQTLRLSISLQ
jgi:hypothetical protein